MLKNFIEPKLAIVGLGALAAFSLFYFKYK